MSWYVVYGDPHWDADELWTTMGHLYKGGMWFKKKSVLIAEGHYNTEKGADNSTDSRTIYKPYSNFSINFDLPSIADVGNYFYLPALGQYYDGKLSTVGNLGNYWSSTAVPGTGPGISGYNFSFGTGYIDLGNLHRRFGFRVGTFE